MVYPSCYVYHNFITNGEGQTVGQLTGYLSFCLTLRVFEYTNANIEHNVHPQNN